MAGTFKIALVQMRCVAERDANLRAADQAIADAARAGAGIVCLPELFGSLYFCQTEDPENFNLAEPIPGPTTESVGAAARRHGTTVIASIFERRAAGVYHNSAAVIGPDGRIAGLYRKMHIPDDPLYFEKFYFAPGDLGFRCFSTPSGPVGVLICWDQWFPEAARLTALQGAQVLFYPTAIGWHPREKAEHGRDQYAAWQTIQRAHAIANGCYVAAVNRVGLERIAGDGLEFWGGSFAADPFGIVLAQAPHDAPQTLVVECDPARLEQVRRNWPFLRDRRIDAYGAITQRVIDPS